MGFRLLMGGVAAAAVAFAALFWQQGAWPVSGFLVLTAAMLRAAFAINYRDGRLYEEVRLSNTSLTVLRVQPNQRQDVWRFEPYWLRVRMSAPPGHDSQICLVSHGKSLIIGAFLPLAWREEVARTLSLALFRWRQPNQ